MPRRYEVSRSTHEIVYRSVGKDGELVYEIGLPDGTIIPYDDYVNHNYESAPALFITTDTPVHPSARPLPHYTIAATAALSIFTLFVIILVAFHAF